jgi:hypothetical protein
LQGKDDIIACKYVSIIKQKNDSLYFTLALNATVSELEKKQFQPRMERLKAIENDIKNRMEEYALAEERMEVSLHLIEIFVLIIF